jgi:hypothetical protein
VKPYLLCDQHPHERDFAPKVFLRKHVNLSKHLSRQEIKLRDALQDDEHRPNHSPATRAIE